jgi:tetratricopeptide (TPR) repeat protein
MISSTKSFRASVIGSAFAFAGLGLASAAFAHMGGMPGGGGMPSATGPSFNPTAEYKKGLDALDANDFKDAAQSFDRVLSVAPKNVQTLVADGYAHAGMQDYPGARDAYKKALDVDSSHIVARRGLALALVSLGDKDGASKELATLKVRAQACGGTCPDASDLNAAVAAVEGAIGAPGGKQSSITSPSLLFASASSGDQAYVAAISYVNEHNYAKALKALDRSVTAFGPHPDILTYIGYTYRKMGRYGMAERYYREALALAPNHRGATEYYGELKMERGDIKGAKLMLAKLDGLCSFGCVDAEVLRQWIATGHE